MGGSWAEGTDATFPVQAAGRAWHRGTHPVPALLGSPAPRLFFGCGQRGAQGSIAGLPEVMEGMSLLPHWTGEGDGDGA